MTRVDRPVRLQINGLQVGYVRRWVIRHWFVRLVVIAAASTALFVVLIVALGTIMRILESKPVPVWWNLLTFVVFFVIFLTVLFGPVARIGMKAWSDVVDHFTLPDESPEKRFPIRKRIARRFVETVDHVLDFMANNKVKNDLGLHLCIVAHSQGTVIAIDKLMDGYLEGLLDRVEEITVLTFGSPFTHVYQYYFPSEYPDLRSHDHESLRAIQRLCENPRVNWVNVYRIDDFVGAYIDGCSPTFPENIPCACGGHTNYWTANVMGKVKPYLPQ